MGIEALVKGSEQVTRVFGYWPSFHDAEIIWLQLHRALTDGWVIAPSLEMVIHAFEMTNEVAPTGHYVLKNHVLVHFRFTGIGFVKLEDFNCQNVLFELIIFDIRQLQVQNMNFEVKLGSSYGLIGGFRCNEAEVLSVTLCDKNGQKFTLKEHDSNMNPAIWNILHDGSIERASGHVPGTVRLEIDIQYLREKFPDIGRLIILTLFECTNFEFLTCEDNVPHGIGNIASICPEILSAREREGLIEVTCAVSKGSGGILRVAAADFSLALDSGRAITLEEIESVAKSYWQDFEKRGKQADGLFEGDYVLNDLDWRAIRILAAMTDDVYAASIRSGAIAVDKGGDEIWVALTRKLLIEVEQLRRGAK